MRVIKILLGAVVLLCLGLLALLFGVQRRLLYFPSHTYVPLSAAHVDRALGELPLRTEDGIDLKGWYAPATSQPFTIVFFHGNADSLSTAARVGAPYVSEGYGFLATEYRGYSGFAGTPTENGLYADGRAYVERLIAKGVAPSRIILFGHSLGTGVAVELATEFRVGGVMLAAPYLSMPRLAQVHYPFFPSALVLDRFENEKKIKSIHAPVLIVNGLDDEVIPAEQGRQLYAMAHDPREYRSLPDRGHNDLFDDFVPLSLDWMSRVCKVRELEPQGRNR